MIAIVLVAGSAGASVLQDATGGAVNYQHDEREETDAADACSDILDVHNKQLTNQTREIPGLLVFGDDESDYYGINATSDVLGHRVRVTVSSNVVDVGLTVFEPACDRTVFEPSEASSEGAATSAAAASEDTKSIEADLANSTCEPGEWKFMLKQGQSSPPPATITVDWGLPDGPRDVPLLHASEGKVAMYVTTDNLAFTVQNATAEVPASWDDTFFKLAHGPCDASEYQPPASGSDFLEFTITQVGIYGVGVLLDTSAEVPMIVIPASCHNLCLPLLEEGQEEGGYDSDLVDLDQPEDAD